MPLWLYVSSFVFHIRRGKERDIALEHLQLRRGGSFACYNAPEVTYSNCPISHLREHLSHIVRDGLLQPSRFGVQHLQLFLQTL